MKVETGAAVHVHKSCSFTAAQEHEQEKTIHNNYKACGALLSNWHHLTHYAMLVYELLWLQLTNKINTYEEKRDHDPRSIQLNSVSHDCLN